jgi:SAM-dependent methyltransferase
MMRDTCAGCGHVLRTVLDLGSTPLANYYPLPGEPDGPLYPLQMATCGVCWLVQQRAVPDPEEIFGSSYGFCTTSPASAAYFGAAADWGVKRLGRDPDRALDIGCNDGVLLQALAARSGSAAGVEPSGAGELALARGLTVIRAQFTRDLAGTTGQADLVTAFHVAAHVADPDDFLAGIALVLKDDGIAVAEFQSLADLVAGGMFDLVYHEHRFFYSLASFMMLAGAHGLTVTEAEPTPAQGGSIRVVLRKGGTPPAAILRWQEAERWLQTWDAYCGLQGRAEHAARRLRDVIADETGDGRRVAGYAASAKACTLLNFAGITRQDLPWVTDTTPGKAGREIPGARIPVQPEGELPDTCLVLAANHLPVILKRMPAEWRAAGGRLIVPLPVPVIM